MDRSRSRAVLKTSIDNPRPIRRTIFCLLFVFNSSIVCERTERGRKKRSDKTLKVYCLLTGVCTSSVKTLKVRRGYSPSGLTGSIGGAAEGGGLERGRAEEDGGQLAGGGGC